MGSNFSKISLELIKVMQNGIKAEIFVGPKIRKLMLNEDFDSRLNPVELAAWNVFKTVVANFLGNHRHEQYADIIDDMLKAYEQ